MTDVKRRRGERPKNYKRTDGQIEADRALLSELFLQGYSYSIIAERINSRAAEAGLGYTITAQQVYYDVKKMLVEWKRQQFDNIDEYITAELKKLDRIEVEAWEAWERSKNERVTDKLRSGDKSYIEKVTEQLNGDPRYLSLLLDVQQRRAKLLGFDAPLKVQVPGLTPGAEAARYNAADIPEAQLFAIADALQAAEFKNIS